jgi:hypothetical protein
MSDNGYYDHPVSAFTAGTRVELHPATDLWMRGARYGAVVTSGRTRVTVRLDATDRTVILRRACLRPLEA